MRGDYLQRTQHPRHCLLLIVPRLIAGSLTDRCPSLGGGGEGRGEEGRGEERRGEEIPSTHKPVYRMQQSPSPSHPSTAGEACNVSCAVANSVQLTRSAFSQENMVLVHVDRGLALIKLMTDNITNMHCSVV